MADPKEGRYENKSDEDSVVGGTNWQSIHAEGDTISAKMINIFF